MRYLMFICILFFVSVGCGKEEVDIPEGHVLKKIHEEARTWVELQPTPTYHHDDEDWIVVVKGGKDEPFHLVYTTEKKWNNTKVGEFYNMGNDGLSDRKEEVRVPTPDEIKEFAVEAGDRVDEFFKGVTP